MSVITSCIAAPVSKQMSVGNGNASGLLGRRKLRRNGSVGSVGGA